MIGREKSPAVHNFRRNALLFDDELGVHSKAPAAVETLHGTEDGSGVAWGADTSRGE